MALFKNKKAAWIGNIIIIGVIGFLLYSLFQTGKQLELARGLTSKSLLSNGTSFIDLTSAVSFRHALSILILQIIIIIIISRIMAWLMSLISQPTVIGEIIAGIMLGPSLLGMFFPEVFTWIFPLDSLKNLEILSQIGLILFMFIIGMELDIGVVRQRAKDAFFISNASIVVPFIMGVGLALFLYERFAPLGADFLSFSLFMGIALSITAFPVLARIAQERGITKTQLGMITITSAAINDITAWGILAIVVAIANATAVGNALVTIGLSLIFIVLMLMVVRPLLDKIANRFSVKETVSKTIVAAVFGTMLLSAYITEVIGIHALFGAFMAGVIMPQNVKFKSIMSEKMEDVSLVLLLPLFFVYTGLRTEIGLLNDSSLLGTAVIVVAIAVIGKFAGSALASRMTGQSWKNSLTIGALMNTRGLIELVALNIGYDIGILSPEIFTMLVLMALITTFMTGPAMSFVNFIYRSKESLTKITGHFKVLISFGPPESGIRLLTLISDLFRGEQNKLEITALHLTPSTNISAESAEEFEEQAFRRIKELARNKDLKVRTEYRTTETVSQEITRTANKGKYNLLVVGSSKPLLSRDKTGGKARYFFENVKSDVALVIDNGFKKINKVLIYCIDMESSEYLQKVSARFGPDIEVDKVLIDRNIIQEKDYTQYDLIVSGLECYRTQRQAGAPWTSGPVSIVIFSQYE